jgi:transposase
VRPKGSAEELERRRRRAIELLKEGHSQHEVGRMVAASQGSVSRWQVMAEGCTTGLEPKPHPGRRRRLTARQHRQLGSMLRKGARSHGWSNDLWTCPRVKILIRRAFGVDYHVDHVRKILVERLEWSSQRPSLRARERETRTRFVVGERLSSLS